MSFVSRSGGEQRRQTHAASGAPPADDFDPADPDTVKVHYDVAGWTWEQRADLTEVLAEAGLPHAWDGDELVVPEAAEAATDALFAELEERIGPFATPLPDDEPATEFPVDDLSEADREVLRSALVDAEIPHRWDGDSVIVATDAEDVVDDLLDAIERGDIAVFDDDGDDADAPPDGVLGRLFAVGDRLARDPDQSSARAELFALAPQLSAGHPPFGVAMRPWSLVVAATSALAAVFDDDADHDRVVAAASELRTLTRPYV